MKRKRSHPQISSEQRNVKPKNQQELLSNQARSDLVPLPFFSASSSASSSSSSSSSAPSLSHLLLSSSPSLSTTPSSSSLSSSLSTPTHRPQPRTPIPRRQPATRPQTIAPPPQPQPITPTHRPQTTTPHRPQPTTPHRPQPTTPKPATPALRPQPTTPKPKPATPHQPQPTSTPQQKPTKPTPHRPQPTTPHRPQPTTPHRPQTTTPHRPQPTTPHRPQPTTPKPKPATPALQPQPTTPKPKPTTPHRPQLTTPQRPQPITPPPKPTHQPQPTYQRQPITPKPNPIAPTHRPLPATPKSKPTTPTPWSRQQSHTRATHIPQPTPLTPGPKTTTTPPRPQPSISPPQPKPATTRAPPPTAPPLPQPTTTNNLQPPTNPQHSEIEDTLLFLSSDGILEDFFQVGPTTPSPKRPTSIQTSSENSIRPRYRRFLILEAKEGSESYTQDVRLIEEGFSVESTAILKDEWYDTPCVPGSILHIVSFERDMADVEEVYVVDCLAPYYLVLHPDTLISPSNAGLQVSCSRRAVLAERLKIQLVATDDEEDIKSGQVLLRGNLFHELFQTSSKNGAMDRESLSLEIRNVVRRNVADLWSYRITDEEMTKILGGKLDALSTWGSTHLTETESAAKPISQGASNPSGIKISKVTKIEETIWSPVFGLKGRIDVMVLVGDEELPLEFKSGKARNPHRAQLGLYTLMMSDRYQRKIDRGLLYALGEKNMELLEVPHSLVCSLLVARNFVAHYLGRTLNSSGPIRLPPMLPGYGFPCQLCPHARSCVLYHKAIEAGTHDFGGKFGEMTGHLSSVHLDYFRLWDKLIDLEKQEGLQYVSYTWRLSPQEREKAGRAVCSLKLEKWEELSSSSFEYTFSREATGLRESDNQIPLNESTDGQRNNPEGSVSRLTAGDLVVLSTMEGVVGLGRGKIQSMGPDQIVICLDHFLQLPPGKLAGSSLWVIDKDEISSGFDRARENLFYLFIDGGDFKRRELVVELRPPKFKPPHSQTLSSQASQPLSMTPSSEPGGGDLNQDQKEAIRKVLECEDYVCILGMPGTGKTTTIAHLINRLVSLGKKVLVSSYTHSAVDNVMRKLDEMGQKSLLRIGGSDRVAPDIKKYSVEDAGCETVHEYDCLINSKSVFGSTCLKSNHSIFRRLRFDYCIVDEASQITQPVSLGPVRLADIFVLVGDDYQLPPLVQSKEALSLGMDVSLFRRLCEAHPQALVRLENQYRMNEDIMHIANVLVYNYRLRCGTEKVASSRLKLDLSLLPPRQKGGAHDWVWEALDPNRSVIFLNTDPKSAKEERVGGGTVNLVESKLLEILVSSLVHCGVDPSKIGVIAPYRAQLRLIKKWTPAFPLLEVSTVDRYQGRDKDCILISFCCSNDSKRVGRLLCDWRRCNVAFTRAKKKLIFVGSMSTLVGSPIFDALFKLLDPKGWIYPLAPDAHNLYPNLPPPQPCPSSSSSSFSSPSSQRSPFVKYVRNSQQPSPITRNIIEEMDVRALGGKY